MAEESNWILVEKEKNDFKKLEEKEKITKLENELKEMDKKIQKINSDHKNEIEEIKQNFKKLIEENNKQLKDENNAYLKQKDEKINYLEEEIKKANNLFDKRIGDLIKLNNLNSVVSLLNCMEFVKIKNKWSVINGRYKCCNNNCINTNKPIGNCIEGNGFGNLINDENIKYIISLKWLGYDNDFLAYAKNTFNKPQNCLNYSFYYFEVKCNFERNINRIVDKMHFGLVNQNANKYVSYVVKDGIIFNEDNEKCKLSTFSFKNDDIFGCGLVYPPTNKLTEGEFPYIFFTQNGKQIGKVVFLKNNSDSYKPFVDLICCSIEANFGNDLETKPFKYDFSKHLIL